MTTQHENIPRIEDALRHFYTEVSFDTTVADEILNFDRKDKVTDISLPQLATTEVLLGSSKKFPKTRPVPHWAFIKGIGDMLHKNNIAFEQEPITVAHSDSQLPSRSDGRLADWFFGRLVTRLKIMNYVTEQFSPAIAIGYNTKGITVALGSRVSVCKNQCIFGEKLCVSYGNGGMPFEKMVYIIQNWIRDMEPLIEADYQILEKMNDTYVDAQNAVSELLGHMLRSAIRMERRQGDDQAPLYLGQLNDFTEKIEKKVNSNGSTLSLYDIYNMGTEILTHSIHNIEYKWNAINNFSNYFTNKFDIKAN